MIMNTKIIKFTPILTHKTKFKALLTSRINFVSNKDE